jgi:3-hydroxyacyl-CoA dehydrogenase
MDYNKRLSNVTILGAAGKMGSGITLLTALEMARLAKLPENSGKAFVLNAMDLSPEALDGLLKYIRGQASRMVVKKPDAYRPLYPAAGSDEELAQAYAEDVLSIIRPVTTLDAAYASTLVFEAVSENPDLKVKLFSQINQHNAAKPWFFTNTSSVPIHLLDERASLEGRVLGFHFYNPPAVQKLVELIVTGNTPAEMHEFALQYAKALKKVVVPSHDFAGFIGNGHFMRDALHGIREANVLQAEFGFPQAIHMINKVSQQFLVRPMGIFQLIDYVGIDVCQYIMKVMNPYLGDEDLHSDLIDGLIEKGVRGGQFSDGSQKDGFLKYEAGKPVGVINPADGTYTAIAEFKASADAALGSLPAACKPWKEVITDPDRENSLNAYFSELKHAGGLGADLARRYLLRSKEIGLKLVADKVAFNAQDVNTVLMTGFFHAYGPVNDYLG